MNSERIDEEGLLKVIQLSELSLKISKLTYPITEAQRCMDEYRKCSLELSEYEQRMGSKLSESQRLKIYNSMEDLEKLIPYMKNKIKPIESLEIADHTDDSLV